MLRHHWVTLVLVVVFLLLVVSVAFAGPVMRGSLQAAEEHWGPLPCEPEIRFAPLGRPTEIGLAEWPSCTITFDSPRARPWKRMPLKFCLVMAHEYGHLAQGASTNSLWHSDDAGSVMYPTFSYRRDTAECRRRWPHRP